MLQRIKELPPEIQEIAFENIQHNAFGLLPENMLYVLLKSDELKGREEAIKRILAIR